VHGVGCTLASTSKAPRGGDTGIATVLVMKHRYPPLCPGMDQMGCIPGFSALQCTDKLASGPLLILRVREHGVGYGSFGGMALPACVPPLRPPS
jgi:hypothetical protein